MHQGIQGDAGAHVVSGTSLASGCVKFLTGQDNLRVNGLPTVRDGSLCLVNCDAEGNGGTQGKINTARSPAPHPPPAGHLADKCLALVLPS